MSIGGLLPVEETCVKCAGYNDVVDAGTRDYRVIGYFATFAAGTTRPTKCQIKKTLAGAWFGDFNYNCSTTWTPGVDGEAPYVITGSAVAVRLQYFDHALTFVPRAVRVDGKGNAGCSFIGNTAGLSGGAIYFASAASNVFIMDSTFANNSALVGGAVTLDDSTIVGVTSRWARPSPSPTSRKAAPPRPSPPPSPRRPPPRITSPLPPPPPPLGRRSRRCLSSLGTLWASTRRSSWARVPPAPSTLSAPSALSGLLLPLPWLAAGLPLRIRAQATRCPRWR